MATWPPAPPAFRRPSRSAAPGTLPWSSGYSPRPAGRRAPAASTRSSAPCLTWPAIPGGDDSRSATARTPTWSRAWGWRRPSAFRAAAPPRISRPFAKWAAFYEQVLMPPAVYRELTRPDVGPPLIDRKSTRLNSSHLGISYAVFCLKQENNSDFPDTRIFKLDRVLTGHLQNFKY